MNLQQTCDPDRLDAFVRGELKEHQESELTAHLDQCASCGEELERRVAAADQWREASELLTHQASRRVNVVDSMKDSSANGSFTTSTAFAEQMDQVVGMLAPTDDPEMLGRIGGYEVSGVIGCGGMGVVFKAHDRSLDRVVAIKVMAPHLAGSGAARKRFARESKAAAAVLHPNVIAIHCVADDPKLPYLVMPYIGGTSLQKRVEADGPLCTQDTLRIGQQIAAGLAAAHAQGLVHRDIKPANILLERGVERVTITDFGLARAVDDATMTRSGVIAGTPQYMSPEQARGESIDHRSDLFSLGSVLYMMCAGHSPFRAETTFGILRRITDNEPRPIREINPDVPEWLCAIIEKLHAKEPSERFQSAEGVAELLEGCLAHVQQPAAIPLPTIVEQLSQLLPVASTAPQPAKKQLRQLFYNLPPIGKFIAAAAGAVALFFAGILIVLELDKGTLTIESELDDVPIRIMQGDEVVKSLTVSKEGATTRIGAGQYIVEIGQEFDKAVIKNGGVELSRGATAIIKVTRINANTPESEKAKDEAAKAWLRRPVLGSFHDGKRFQLAGHDGLMHCVMSNNSESLNRLLTMDKYDLDFSPGNGQWTLLQTALLHNCVETTSLLLRHGASPSFASKGTPLPLEIAERSGRPELVLLVQEYIIALDNADPQTKEDESKEPSRVLQLDKSARVFLQGFTGAWKLNAISFDCGKFGNVLRSKMSATIRPTLVGNNLEMFIGSQQMGPAYEIGFLDTSTTPMQITLNRYGTFQALLSFEDEVLTLARPIRPGEPRPQSFEPAKGVVIYRWTRMSEQNHVRAQTSSTEVALGEGPDIAELQEVADGSHSLLISDQYIRQSRDNIEQISLAFHNYHEEHDHLPGFASVDGNGSPLLSWRVHLLPYMGDETKTLYGEFRLNEAWDSPHNKKLVARMPSVYSVPLADPLAIGHTCYVVPRSDLTLFPDHARGIDFSDIYQGLPNIVLVVEGDRDVATAWTEPTDLAFDRKAPLAHLGNLRDGGFLVSWASSKISFIPNTIAAHHQDRTEFLRGLFEQVGGRGVEYYLDLPVTVEGAKHLDDDDASSAPTGMSMLFTEGGHLNNDVVPSTDGTQDQPQPANPQADVQLNRTGTLAQSQTQVIAKGIAFLKAKQHDDGSWEGTPVDGVTGLAAAALLQAGVKVDDPAILKALAHLRKVEPNMTYTVALQTIVFCEASRQEDAELIRRNVAWLEKAQVTAGDSPGSWSYGINPGVTGDGSCTRFALLGLDAARKAGFDVQEKTWQRVSDYLLTHQSENGGWGYIPGNKTTLTMTLAGVSGLATANRHLPRNDQSMSREAAIRKSEKLIEMSMREFPGEIFVFYALHCLERAGHLSDITRFGELDWKEFVSQQLLSTQKTNSSYGLWRSPNATECDVIATSFALLTLCGQPEPKPTVRVHAQTSSTEVALGEGPDIADLLETAAKHEEWVSKVRSIHFRAKGKNVQSEKALEVERAKLIAGGADAAVPIKSPSLFPAFEFSEKVAWDGTRVATIRNYSFGLDDSHWVWNGSQFTLFRDGPAAAYLLDNEAPIDVKTPLAGSCHWPFDPRFELRTAPTEDVNGFQPNEFTLHTPELFHGVPCHRLVAVEKQIALFIDADSGRMIGKREGILTEPIVPILKSLGHDVRNADEARKLLSELAPAQLLEVRRAGEQIAKKLATDTLLNGPTLFETWVSDFKPTPLGVFPMKHYERVSSVDSDAVYEKSRSELEVTEMQLNESIDPSLFEIKLREGLSVVDNRFATPITYSYASRNSNTVYLTGLLQKMLNSVKELDTLVGRPLPALENLTRINSEARDSASFHGRPLIIECWSVSCGPCRNHFETLNSVFEGGKIQVIGFHTADKDVEAITKFAQDRKLNYPIVVDTGDDSKNAFGPLPVTRMPYTILVDATGTIVAHGDLETLLPKAFEMIATNKPGAAQRSEPQVTLPPMEFDTQEDFLKAVKNLFDKEMLEIDERLATAVERSAVRAVEFFQKQVPQSSASGHRDVRLTVLPESLIADVLAQK